MNRPLIWSSVPQNLDLDAKELLEEIKDQLDGADCSLVNSILSEALEGEVSKMMIAILNAVRNYDFEALIQLSEGPPIVEYLKVQEYPDPFQYLSLLSPVDSNQKEELEEAIDAMLQRSAGIGFPKVKQADLQQTLYDRKDFLRTEVLSGPPVK